MWKLSHFTLVDNKRLEFWARSVHYVTLLLQFVSLQSVLKFRCVLYLYVLFIYLLLTTLDSYRTLYSSDRGGDGDVDSTIQACSSASSHNNVYC